MPGKETNQISSLFRVQNDSRGQEPAAQEGKSFPFPATDRKLDSLYKGAKINEKQGRFAV